VVRSRSIAVFALVAIVLLRGVGYAADAWTANAVECCCGRHAVDHDCGCPMCPSHPGDDGQRHHDHGGSSQLRSCAHHVNLAPIESEAPAVLAPLAIAIAPPRTLLPSPLRSCSFESRVVHPETPPS
jgi:hypothetical protein